MTKQKAGYLAWHCDAHRRDAKGQNQYQCICHGLWHWWNERKGHRFKKRKETTSENRTAIKLTRGMEAIIDPDMFDILNEYKWSAVSRGGGSYSARTAITIERIGKKRQICFPMHHAIIGRPLGKLEVDHINRNSLDNRRVNLRIVTHHQNMTNLTRQPNLDLIGVGWDKRRSKWHAQATVKGRTHFLGYFDDPKKASEAYKSALLNLAGIKLS